MVRGRNQLFFSIQDAKHFLCVMLETALSDRNVTRIHIILNGNEEIKNITKSLMEAAKQGIKVFVSIAKDLCFDSLEDMNLLESLKKSGCFVRSSVSDWNVHANLCVITRVENGEEFYQTFLATYNFEELSEHQDLGIAYLTELDDIGYEARSFFAALFAGEYLKCPYHLLVSPKGYRRTLLQCIKKEKKRALKGKDAYIGLKIRELSDEKLVKALASANASGVQIEISLNAAEDASRLYLFGKGKRCRAFIGSADGTKESLKHQIEVGIPIYEEDLKDELVHYFKGYIKENIKSMSYPYNNNMSILAMLSQIESESGGQEDGSNLTAVVRARKRQGRDPISSRGGWSKSYRPRRSYGRRA